MRYFYHPESDSVFATDDFGAALAHGCDEIDAETYERLSRGAEDSRIEENEMDKDTKEALSAISNVCMAAAKVMREQAQVFEMSGATLKLLAGAAETLGGGVANATGGAAPAAPARGKPGPKPRAAAAAPAGPSLEEVVAKVQELHKIDKPKCVQLTAIMQRHGITKASEANPSQRPQLLADLIAAIGGTDFTASIGDDTPDDDSSAFA